MIVTENSQSLKISTPQEKVDDFLDSGLSSLFQCLGNYVLIEQGIWDEQVTNQNGRTRELRSTDGGSGGQETLLR